MVPSLSPRSAAEGMRCTVVNPALKVDPTLIKQGNSENAARPLFSEGAGPRRLKFTQKRPRKTSSPRSLSDASTFTPSTTNDTQSHCHSEHLPERAEHDLAPACRNRLNNVPGSGGQ
ncbi:hypothetical protein KFL_012240020 [Klebsormidium nitens]|uniref:Uncharacterized protein n=1 Tax=Klebsormidium nitens TaxID=105231 RepID=A0A1Y1IQ17_KLENI|nr:hypothetical protein KFL_012240020 [Klebsormidium nitens]|eukprot:GAQ92960.1 hypothetical protein KFL_012240020 [Klebsormidium nitens]